MTLQTFSALDGAVRASALNLKYDGFATDEILRRLAFDEFPGKIALASAFGTESAVLLHLIAGIDVSLPIIFLDTQKHFDETISYRDDMVSRFGFTNVQVIAPAATQLQANDPAGTLHRTNPDLCCYVRKTLPLVTALQPFSCWINGRKRFQGHTRAELGLFEAQDKWVKVNPLMNWTEARIQDYLLEYDLPRHPLEAYGYTSIGCSPCTEPNPDCSNRRSGRWKGSAKLECGIHLPAEEKAPLSLG